jgi:hypothetical protein
MLIAAGTAAQAANCKDEVASALKRQRETSGFRMAVDMIDASGKVKMMVEYVLPNRMRQVISSTADPQPVETIVVGNYAWSRREGDKQWTVLNPQITQQLIGQMKENIGEEQGELTDFECLGKKPVSGKDYLAYQGENDQPGPKNLSKQQPPKLPDRPVRVIYVDSTTGLPVRSVFGRADKLDKPIFEATYSYPIDLKIDPPMPIPATADAPAKPPQGK